MTLATRKTFESFKPLKPLKRLKPLKPLNPGRAFVFGFCLIFVVICMQHVVAQETQNEASQTFFTEFKISDSSLDFAALRQQVLSVIDALEITLQSVKDNLHINNITVHNGAQPEQ